MKNLVDIDKLKTLFDGKENISKKDIENACVSPFNINRLISYGIISPEGKGNYKIIKSVEGLNDYNVTMEIEALKNTYFNFYNKAHYQEASEYLDEYINICKANHIMGHYYYYLQNLHEKKNLLLLPSIDAEASEKLHKEFDEQIKVKNYNQALDIAKNYLTISKGNNVYSYLLIGTAYNYLKKDEEAGFYLSEAYDVLPNSPSVLLELAKLHFRCKNLDLASEDLNDLLELDEINFNGLVMTYKVNYLKGDFASCTDIYQKAKSRLSSKLFKSYQNCIDKFIRYLLHVHDDRLEKVKKLSYSEDDLSVKIKKINEFILSLDDYDINKTLLLFDSLNVVDPEVREIYRLAISEEDREFVKPYVKKINTLKKQSN